MMEIIMKDIEKSCVWGACNNFPVKVVEMGIYYLFLTHHVCYRCKKKKWI